MESPVVTTSSEVANTDTVGSSEPSEVKEDVTKTVESSLEAAIEKESASESDVSNKELSWEKIAAEIAEADAQEYVAPPDMEITPIAQLQEDTVTTGDAGVTIERTTVTEPDSSDQVGESIGTTLIEEAEQIIEDPEVASSEKVVEVASEEPQTSSTDDYYAIDESQESQPDEAAEQVQITELNSSELENSAESIHYSVVEAEEEAETNEIIEEHITATNSDTVLIINSDNDTETHVSINQIEEDDDDENSETVYLIEQEEDDTDRPETPEKAPKPKKPRGRKSIAEIPLHVLGRDISKPTDGVSNGGRAMPKPRLGVKVPYRNLTSQIVSKAEIEKELMDRLKTKQEQILHNSGNLMFTRKLTQRLAKKLLPTEKGKKSDPEASSSSDKATGESSEEIKDDSDLIAILEGDGDLNISKAKEVPEKSSREMEIEIALQQLKELPDSDEKSVPKAAPVQSAVSKKVTAVEPKLRTGMVVKTYARKRKSTESVESPSVKKAVATPSTPNIKIEDGNVYMTKSSRVIKKKVIWDPDEMPAKSPPTNTKPAKPEVTVKAAATPIKSSAVAKTIVAVKAAATPVKSEKAGEPEKKIATPAKKILPKRVSSPAAKRPKRLTEVDKLLMDEGAVNMIYDVKNNEENKPKNKKSVISLDKAHKELMSKTNVIMNDLQQSANKDGQKTLRKKDSVMASPKSSPKKEAVPSAITRKKSKDSTRSSVHSRQGSPTFEASASRIIRRHSSSSFSSDDVDEESDHDVEERVTRRKASSMSSSAEVPKKKAKKAGKDVKNNNNGVKEANNVEIFGKYETFTASKTNQHITITLLADGKCYLTQELLKELTSCLKDIAKNDECIVVSITSNSSKSFCEGLDYSLLAIEDESTRKKKATEVASLVKEFLRCLINFPKILVAGIQGDCVGLGVTMLPLFDMVISSDTSTFSAPYSKLGCVAEAGFLLSVPYLSSHGLASELLYSSQKITADDAFRRGLVTRLCWPEKYHEELKTILKGISSQSRQSLEASKQQLRHHHTQSIDSSLNTNGKVLIDHWISDECQSNFSNYKLEVE